MDRLRKEQLSLSFPLELDLKSKLGVQVSRFQLSQSRQRKPWGSGNKWGLLLRLVLSHPKQAHFDCNRRPSINTASVLSEPKGKKKHNVCLQYCCACVAHGLCANVQGHCTLYIGEETLLVTCNSQGLLCVLEHIVIHKFARWGKLFSPCQLFPTFT